MFVNICYFDLLGVVSNNNCRCIWMSEDCSDWSEIWDV